METKKLTDEEIIKAFEHCNYKARDFGCTDCPYSYFVKDDIRCNMKQMQIDALDLIRRQKAEIERLTEENGYLDMVAQQALADYQNAQVQVDELKAKQVIECHGMLKGCDMVQQAVKDKAKEIIDFVYKSTANIVLKEKLCKRYGVEVDE